MCLFVCLTVLLFVGVLVCLWFDVVCCWLCGVWLLLVGLRCLLLLSVGCCVLFVVRSVLLVGC